MIFSSDANTPLPPLRPGREKGQQLCLQGSVRCRMMACAINIIVFDLWQKAPRALRRLAGPKLSCRAVDDLENPPELPGRGRIAHETAKPLRIPRPEPPPALDALPLVDARLDSRLTLLISHGLVRRGNCVCGALWCCSQEQSHFLFPPRLDTLSSPALSQRGNVAFRVWCVPGNSFCHTRAIPGSAAYPARNKALAPQFRSGAGPAPAGAGCANLDRQEGDISPPNHAHSEEYQEVMRRRAGFAPDAWLRFSQLAAGQPARVGGRLGPSFFPRAWRLARVFPANSPGGGGSWSTCSPCASYGESFRV